MLFKYFYWLILVGAEVGIDVKKVSRTEIISKIEGIGPIYGKKLAKVGIKTLDDLQKMRVHSAHAKTGISVRQLTKWKSMSDLQQVGGIDNQISEVLVVRARVTDLHALAAANPNYLLRKIREARRPRRMYNIIPDTYTRVITLAEVKAWQNEARRIIHPAYMAVSKPKMITRSEWGARDPKGGYKSHSPYQITIHHTVTPKDGASRVRSIQNYHMDKKGWIDIGYHYLIDSQGRIYEGRPAGVVGAHVRGHNTGNIGIAVIGNYENEDITSTQQKAIEDLGVWLCSTYSISTDRIYGHRDFASTTCPGKYLYNRLSKIRSNIKSRLTKSEPEKPEEKPSGGECFIATAAYESAMAPEVQFLRDFRDKVLRKTRWGTEFFENYWKYYYRISPTIVEKMNRDPQLKSIIRWSLVVPLVNYLKLVMKRPSVNPEKVEPAEVRAFLEDMKKDMDAWLSSIKVPETFEGLNNESIIDELNIALDFVLKEGRDEYLDKLIAVGSLPLKYNQSEEKKLFKILLESGRSPQEINKILYGKRRQET
ncbi:hypothetical protein ES703_55382 [subsurface metagenome]